MKKSIQRNGSRMSMLATCLAAAVGFGGLVACGGYGNPEEPGEQVEPDDGADDTSGIAMKEKEDGGDDLETTGEELKAFHLPTHLPGFAPDVTLHRGFHCIGGWGTSDCDHVLTANKNEIWNAGYTYDGTIGMCWSTSGSGRVPLHRLRHSGRSDHLYTTNDYEVARAQYEGFVYEGTPCYVYSWMAFGNLRPIYRLFDTRHTDHLFTNSYSEYVTLSGQVGWRAESSAAWYMVY